MRSLYWGVAVFLCVVSLLGADVYQWKDSDGVTHFSDMPHSGAKKLDLPSVQTYTPAPLLPPTPKQVAKEIKKNVYQTLTILLPTEEQTIWDNNGNVPVRVSLSPTLKKGDRLQLIYDGEPIGQPQTGYEFLLKNVYRGSHTISVQVVSMKGDVLIKSDTITFYLQRAAIRRIHTS